MILNIHDQSLRWDFGLTRPTVTVTVDGVAIPEVWYADLHRGVVKTYDVRSPLGSIEFVEPESESFAETVNGGVLSRTLHGKVKIVMESPENTGKCGVSDRQ